MGYGDFSGVLAGVREHVGAEHTVFKCNMLSKSPAEIYDSYIAIAFHECIHEYFQYVEHISPRHAKACQNCGDVAASLYNIYLEYEHTRFSTWDGIRGLLDIMADRQEGGGA